MRPLLTLSARWIGLSTAIVLVVGVGAALVRLLPWLAAPGVPLGVAIPFAEHLARAALEVSVVVGLPVGASVAAALFVESGASRALLSLGASPVRLVRSVVVVVAVFVAASALAGFMHGGVDHPGRVAARLVDAGRAACAEDPAPSRVDLPFAGAGWLCFRAAPRLVGRVPGLRSDFVFSASQALTADDLSSVELRELRIAGRVEDEAPVVDVRVERGRVLGLPAVGAARSRWQGALRGTLLAGAAAASALLLAWAIVRHSIGRPIFAACAAGAVGISLLFAMREWDRKVQPSALPVALRSDT